MEEIKNRGWVKNAAIIFLSAMLFLTFFSNTILNKSLPEVATVAVKSDSITAKVRGTGKVKASEVYTVKADQTTKVTSVKVKEGDEVKVGDLLFVLSIGDSKELKQLKEEYYALELAYKQALLGNAGTDHSAEYANVNKLLAKRDEAKARLDSYFNGVDYQTAIRQSQQKIDQLTRERDAIVNGILNGDGGSYAIAVDARDKAEKERDDAKKKLDSANQDIASKKQAYDIEEANYTAKESAYKVAEANYTAAESAYNTAANALNAAAVSGVTGADLTDLQDKLNNANTAFYNAQAAKSKAETEMNDASTAKQKKYDEYVSVASGAAATETIAYNAAEQKYQEKKKAVEDILLTQTSRITAATADVDARLKNEQSILTNAQNYVDIYDNAQTSFLNANSALLSALASEGNGAAKNKLTIDDDKRKMDAKLKEIEDMEYGYSAETRKKIDDLQAEIDLLTADIAKEPSEEKSARLAELQKELEGIKNSHKNSKEIRSTINGFMTSVPVSAGSDITKGDVLGTIANSDSGYTVEIGVTADQAQRIRVGDEGTISNFYWGSNISAKVKKINPDKNDPRNKKTIVFDIDGGVSEGQELTISVGSKSSSYDMVVPASAVRKDTNGQFVLVLTSKNNALGNRYFAKRVNVEVLATDDVSSAITGDLNNGDYVITTASKPIKDKDQCKLAN